MHVNITGRKTQLKEAFKEKVIKKVGKFERFFEPDATAFVTVTIEGERQTVEITIKNKGIVFRSEETTPDMSASLDIAIDHILRQIHKNKTRLERRLRVGAFESVQEVEEIPPIEAVPSFDVVKVKSFPVKPMDVQEAILQMNLSGHLFFAFLNAESEDVNIVYKRSKGGYGVLEPVANDED
ncbi:MAG: ribosome-associated translation inhibitor RaiA [Ethanoligenens sp.]|uniref:ribosome hibernation-promoting factor, HPF/YfiA family n=1 Tax=Ethanoligenens sp. TaxID=2099655 RepID=UPI0039E95BA9